MKEYDYLKSKYTVRSSSNVGRLEKMGLPCRKEKEGEGEKKREKKRMREIEREKDQRAWRHQS